ncbi:MAG: MvaI/BcnI restriction endonuclease family protein [Bacteroidetes bacterium]|nr:MAG: MvaI/BcnI restriction endonuclease family protein [Bacteroidota bacterium]
MNLQNLKSLFIDNGCSKIYIKKLSLNDNSKNQVYFGGSFEILNILPISEIKTEEAGDWNKERFKASIKFSWINEDGKIYPAPNSQLILYPKYPEVRFSGFLQKCQNPPSELMSQRLADRILFFSIDKNGTILGFVAAPNSEISNEFKEEKNIAEHGVFMVIELPKLANNKYKLINELIRIHQLGWIKSKSLTKDGIVPCESSQCGGYTLEAELGIIRNGISEPDFLGWEIKNFGVSKLDNLNSKVLTLFSPEPTGGFYRQFGKEEFIKKYGYADKKGRENRINFGGIYKIGKENKLTNQVLKLIGFDTETGKIRNSNGKIGLFDSKGVETASWDFATLLLHWNRKHNQTCYVPSLSNKLDERSYKYGNKILLCEGTNFQLFLQQMANGNVYYDPGIKMENAYSKIPKIKPRSQFRMKSQFLSNLYLRNEILDITKPNS